MRPVVTAVWCLAAAQLTSSSAQDTPDKVPVEKVWTGVNSPVPEKKSAVQITGPKDVKDDWKGVVVRDPREWADLWELTHSRGKPMPEVPVIDFGRDMVVAVFAGPKDTGGYAVEIKGAVKRGGDLTLHANAKTPHPDKMYSQSRTSPYALVVVPRTDGKVVVDVKEAK